MWEQLIRTLAGIDVEVNSYGSLELSFPAGEADDRAA